MNHKVSREIIRLFEDLTMNLPLGEYAEILEELREELEIRRDDAEDEARSFIE